VTDYSYSRQLEAVYPSIARQVLAATGVTHGNALDLGCGAGHQGLALAQASSLDLWLLDLNREGLELADQHIEALGLGARARTVLGDACALPALEVEFDLVVSRGSIDFWGQPERGLREAWRVLKPGGWAWIGGGFGSVDQRIEVNRRLGSAQGSGPDSLRNPDWLASVQWYRGAAEASGIRPYQFIDDNAGIWIVFQKE